MSAAEEAVSVPNGKTTKGEFLQHFWDLSVDDHQKRIEAANKLVAYLDSVKANDTYDRDLAYATKRLVRGLTSSREFARPGYATALTALLEHEPKITTKSVYELIQESSDVKGSLKGSELRDQYFGRLFGYAALERANRFQTKDEDEMILLGSILKECCELSQQKKWLADLCVEIAVSIIEHLSAKSKKSIKLVVENVPAIEHTQLSEFKPHELVLSLALQQKFNKKLSALEPISTLLTTPILASGEMEKLNDPLLSACKTFPRLHTVWIYMMTQLIETPDLLVELWNTVVENGLIHSSHERKCTAFHLFLELARICIASGHPSIVARFLTKEFLRCVINNCSSNNNYLHVQAKSLLKKLLLWMTKWQDKYGAGYAILNSEVDAKELKDRFEQARIAIVGALLSQRDRSFDLQTGVPIVKSLLATLGPKAINQHLAYLKTQFVEAAELESAAQQQTQQNWVVDALFSLTKSVADKALKKETSEKVAFFFATIAFFEPHEQVSKKKKKSKTPAVVEEARSVSAATKNLSAKTQAKCERLFFAILSNHTLSSGFVRTLFHDKKDAKYDPIAQITASMAKVQVFNSKCKVLLDSGFELRNPRTVGESKAVDTAFTLIEDENNAPELLAVRFIVAHVLVQSLRTSRDEVSIELAETIEDLKECYNRMGGKKKKKKTDDDELAILVDILLSLISQNSALLRDVVNTAFKVLCPKMSAVAIDTLISVLVTRNSVQLGAEANDGMDDEEELLMEVEQEDNEMEVEEDDKEDKEEESDDEKSDENSKEEDSDEDSDSEIDADIDEEAAAKLGIDSKTLAKALVDQAPEEDENENEEMDKYDEALAAYIRARNEAKKNKGKRYQATLAKQKVTFKSRVLDMVDIYLITCGETSPLVMLTPIPLLQAAARCLKSGGVFVNEESKQLFSRLRKIILRFKKLIKPGKNSLESITLSKQLVVAASFMDSNEDEVDGDMTVDVALQLSKMVEKSIASAKAAGNDDLMSMCTSVIVLAQRLSNDLENSEEFNTFARGVCDDAVEDWLSRKSSRLSLSFMQDLVTSQPRLGWLMVPKVCQMAIDGENAEVTIHSAFHRCEALRLLVSAMKNIPTVQGSQTKDVEFFVEHVALLWKCFAANLAIAAKGPESSTQQGMLKTSRVKQILQYGKALVDQTKNLPKEQLNTAFNVGFKKQDISKSVEQLVENSESPMIRNMLKPIEEFVASNNVKQTSQAKTPKKKKKKAVAQTPDNKPAKNTGGKSTAKKSKKRKTQDIDTPKSTTKKKKKKKA